MRHWKTLLVFGILIAVLLCATALMGCSGNDDSDSTTENNEEQIPGEPVVYTIQYTDDAGTHTIEVEDGDPYYITIIPQREGYEFIGLYDAEVGGTQYVSASGSSISVFTDKKNMVLFPHYKAVQYTLVLDYGEAPVTGDRQLSVNYGESLPELPKNLTVSHKTFDGWYTGENRTGVKVADMYGSIPVVSVVNSENFDTSSKYIYLYAGFVTEQVTVTFNFGASIDPVEMGVDYDTPISEIVPSVRNNEGEAVLTWSKNQNGSQIFNGNITDNTVLYAVEWAPVIELDSNGGEEINPVVARASTSITLPTPVRENYKFMGWQTVSGEIVDIDSMPESSTSLIARWQAMIVFDENKGTEVNDISVVVGTEIELPIPERDGYIFAGWYTGNKEQYTSNKMPANSIALKAGWYEAKTVSRVLVSANNFVEGKSLQDTFIDELTLNFSEYLSSDFNGLITVVVKWKERHTEGSQNSVFGVRVGFYSQRIVSDEYKIASTYYGHDHSDYIDMQQTITTQLKGNMIYVTIASGYREFGISRYFADVSDYRYELTYPDTTILYL